MSAVSEPTMSDYRSIFIPETLVTLQQDPVEIGEGNKMLRGLGRSPLRTVGTLKVD